MIQIPNYSIKEIIGEGGMATVYLAEHDKFKTLVCIKVLKKEWIQNENIRKRFLAEARNLYKMSHPNIIKVTDLYDEDELVAFVMEYIDGQSLKEYIDAKGKLREDEIRQIFAQILDAVGYVHEEGLVHRDIKPSNFMLTKKGTIKLLDFGIAKNINASSPEYTTTGTTQQMGTPIYMSPEQIRSTKDVNHQSDIYSLGVVLWQMVTGHKPYNTDTLSAFDIQYKIVTEKLPVTGSNFDGLIAQATAKELEKRFLDCQIFKNELENLFGSIGKLQPTQQVNNANTSSEATVLINKSEQTVVNGLDSTVVGQNEVNAEVETLIKVKINDKYGYINIKEEWKVQPNFDYLSDFDNEGYCQAEIGDKYGYINRKGEWKIKSNKEDFDDAGYCKAAIGDKWGLINRKGEWLIQPNFDDFYRINVRYVIWVTKYEKLGCQYFDNEGYCKAKIGDKWGFINIKGDWLIPPNFDDLDDFDNEGYCQAKIGDKWGFINRKGDWLIPPNFDDLYDFDNEGYSIAEIGDKRGFINRKGEWIIPPNFERFGMFDKMGYCFAKLANKTRGFINRKGEWIIPPKFYDCSEYFDSEDHCRVRYNGKEGVINRNGDWVIQPVFECIFSFDNEGYSSAKIGDKWGFINRKGEWIIQPHFDNLHYHFDDEGFCWAQLNGKEGFINRNGQWIIQPHFDKLEKEYYKDGYFWAQLNGKEGFINRNGQWIIQPHFDELDHQFHKDGYCKASIGGKFGFINQKGEWLIKPQFEIEKIDEDEIDEDEIDEDDEITYAPQVIISIEGTKSLSGNFDFYVNGNFIKKFAAEVGITQNYGHPKNSFSVTIKISWLEKYKIEIPSLDKNGIFVIEILYIINCGYVIAEIKRLEDNNSISQVLQKVT